MTTFTVDQYPQAKEVAKEFGINPVGKRKEVLVQLVNDAITEKNAEPTVITTETGVNYIVPAGVDIVAADEDKKEEHGYNKGDLIEIVCKTVVEKGVEKEILKGRKARIVGPSQNQGMIKVVLINDRTGEEQNCPITVELKKIFLVKKKEEQVA